MPLDPSTFGGYMVYLVGGSVYGLTYLILTTTIASNFLSMGFCLRALYEHYESMFRSMNGMAEDSPLRQKAALIEAINVQMRTIQLK